MRALLVASLAAVSVLVACRGDSAGLLRQTALPSSAVPVLSVALTMTPTTGTLPPPPTVAAPTTTATPVCPLTNKTACDTLFRIDASLKAGDVDAVAGMFQYEDTGCAAYTDPLMIISPVIARYAGCLYANPDLQTRCLWVLNERTPAQSCRARLAAIHTCACGDTNANFRYLTHDQLRDLLLPEARVVGVIESVGFRGQTAGPFILIDTASRPIPDPFGSPLFNRWALKVDTATGRIAIAYPHIAGPDYYFENADFLAWN